MKNVCAKTSCEMIYVLKLELKSQKIWKAVH